MDGLKFRRASGSDIPFLISAIKAAEAGADGRCTYQKLFSLADAELDELLTGALTADTSGHQLALNSFFLYEADGLPVATCAGWIEAEDGVASGFKTAAILSSLVGPERWIGAKKAIQALSQAAPARTPGVLQLETFCVTPSHRGRGLTARIIGDVMATFPQAEAAEIMLFETNMAALRAYEKAGFHVHSRRAGFIQLKKTVNRAV